MKATLCVECGASSAFESHSRSARRRPIVVASSRSRRSFAISLFSASTFAASTLSALPDVTSADARIAWLERWRDEITRPMRHRGLHRYTFAIDRRAPIAYGPARAYPKKAA